MKKIISIVSTASFFGAILIGAYGLLRIYLLNRDLPPGVCPVNTFRPLLYVALGLSLLSFVLSFVQDKLKKKENHQE